MRAALLHLDDALVRQPVLTEAVGGRTVNGRDLGPALRLWSRPKALDRLAGLLRETLTSADGAMLTFAGSGDFHHVTPLLLQRAIEAAGCDAVTLLHLDNHPDWVRFADGEHCGSWVGRAARLPQVTRVLTVGVCSPDIGPARAGRGDMDLVMEDRLELYAYAAPDGGDRVRLCGREWPTIASMGEAEFLGFLPGRIPTRAVYVTIDKDVLRAEDAATNWDQGRTSLVYLKAILEPVFEHHEVIGADVVGDWSRASYGGGPLAGLLKRSEALLDQPWTAPRPAALAANQQANLELLALMTEGRR